MELEHETFRSAKVANLYKASVLKKVGARQGPGGAAPHPGGHSCRGKPGSPPSLAAGISSQPCGARTCPVSSCLQA